MSEEIQGEQATSEVVESAPESAPEQVDTIAEAAAEVTPGSEVDDALYEAMEAELKGEPLPEPAPERGLEAQDIAPDLHEPAPEEVPSVPDNLIDPDKEYLFKDADGNEVLVKGSDAIYQTSMYHRKMQQINDELQQYKPLEQMFQHEKGRLATEVLKSADPAERLAAISAILRESGLTDVAGQVDQRMQASNLQYDPMAQQAQILQQQRAELERQQHQMQAQQALQTDTANLERKLGRSLSAREMGGINNVFQQWIDARQANPHLQRPSFESAYKMAQDAIRFEDSQRAAVKPAAPTSTPAAVIERPTKNSRPDGGMPSDDDLFAAAMAEQHISF